MRAGCIGWPGGMISSPVERIATIGLRQTSTSATPIAASTPVSRLVRICPRRNTVSPAVMSVPANDTPLPAVTARPTRNSLPATSACSTITTASAPRGIMPPVAMATASPSRRWSSARRPCESLRRPGARRAGPLPTRRTCLRRPPRSRPRWSDRTTARPRAKPRRRRARARAPRRERHARCRVASDRRPRGSAAPPRRDRGPGGTAPAPRRSLWRRAAHA